MPRVYLHGIGLNAKIWQTVGVRDLCLDLPGHGDAPCAADTTIAAYAEALRPKLPERPILIGHSMGGMVSLQLAAMLGTDCAAVILLDAPMRLPTADLPVSVEKSSDALMRYAGPENMAPFVALQASDPEIRTAMRASMRNMRPDGLRDSMIAAAAFDGWSLLPQVKAPMMAIVGMRSILAGLLAARGIRQAKPDAVVRELNTGHLVPFDEPTLVEANIVRFLHRFGIEDIRPPR